MHKLDIEQSLRRCVEQDTPDLLDSLMTTPVKKLSSEDYIVKQRPVERTSGIGRFVAAFGSVAMVCLVCMSFLASGGWNTIWQDDAGTFISIDVNPSIEMMADDNNMVSGLHGLNEDAELVLQDVNQEDNSLDQVVSSLVESMADHGYLKPEVQNSILVSVENKDAEKAEQIKTVITNDIYEALDKSEIDSVVLTQDVKKTKELEKEAKALNISVGKMNLIQTLAEKDAGLDVQQMAEMSISDISDLAQEREVDITDTVDYGKAQQKEEPSVGVPVEKTEQTTEAMTSVDAASTDTTTNTDSSASTNNTTSQTTAATTQAPPVNYEVNDNKQEPVAPEPPVQQETQVVDQDPNVVAKPVEEPTTAPVEPEADSYEIQDNESGEIME
jgi:hypothetical protein